MTRTMPALLLLLMSTAHATESSDDIRDRSAQRAVVQARAFDVVPNTNQDAGPAFRRMLDTIIKAGAPVQIQLEKGVYRIGEGVSHYAAITIEKANHLVIRGEGAETEIILTNPRQGGFFIKDCSDTWIEHLSVDHDPIPYTQGHVMLVNATEGWFDFVVQPGYPSLDEPWFADAPKPYGQWGMIFDPVEPRLKAGTADFIFMDTWDKLGRRVWRMRPVENQRERLNDLRLGDRFVHMARHGKGGCFFFYRSSECGVRNVTVYASQSLAVGSVAADRITVDGMIVQRRPGTDRLLTTNSDGVHCQQNIRGPLIENCRFESMADDSINIYYFPNTVTGVISDTVIRANRPGIIEAGDWLHLFEPNEGRIVAQVTVQEVRDAPEGEYRITLAEPVSGLRAIPGTLNIYNLSRCGADFVIRNNEFHNHRRHGMMIKAPNGLIENNLIDGVGALGMVVGNDPEWPEGVIPTDLTIRGNTIKDTGRSRGYGQDARGAAIQLMTKAQGGRLAAERYLQHVVMENNTVINPPGAAVYIGAAQDVAIDRLHVLYQGDATMPRQAATIIVEDASGIRIKNLRVESQQPDAVAGVWIESSVDAGEAGITMNGLYITGPPAMKPFIDRRN